MSYPSSANDSSFTRSNATRSTRDHTDAAGVNTRMDRLTREMVDISEATDTGDHRRAGRSLGVRIKVIGRKRSLRNELNGIEGDPVRKKQRRSRTRSLQEDQTSSGTLSHGRLPFGALRQPTKTSSRAHGRQRSTRTSNRKPFGLGSSDSSFEHDQRGLMHGTAAQVTSEERESLNCFSDSRSASPDTLPKWIADRIASARGTTSPSPLRAPTSVHQRHEPAVPAVIPRFAPISRLRFSPRVPSITPHAGDPSPPAQLLDSRDLEIVWKRPPDPHHSDSSPFTPSLDHDSIFEPNLFARQFSRSPSPQRTILANSDLSPGFSPSEVVSYLSPSSRGQRYHVEPWNPVPRFEEAARLRSPSEFMMSKPRPPLPPAASSAPHDSIPEPHETLLFDSGASSFGPVVREQVQIAPNFVGDLVSFQREPLWLRPPRAAAVASASIALAQDERLEATRRLFERELFSPTANGPAATTDGAPAIDGNGILRLAYTTPTALRRPDQLATSRSTPTVFSPLLFSSPTNPFQVANDGFSLSSSSSSSLLTVPNDENLAPSAPPYTVSRAFPARPKHLADVEEEEGASPISTFSPLHSDEILLDSPERGDADGLRAEPTDSSREAVMSKTSRPRSHSHLPPSERFTRSTANYRNDEVLPIRNKETASNRGKGIWNPVNEASAMGKILQAEHTEKASRQAKVVSRVAVTGAGAEMEEDPIEDS